MVPIHWIAVYPEVTILYLEEEGMIILLAAVKMTTYMAERITI